MYKKHIGTLIVAIMAITIAACKRDEEVNSILATVDSFTTEITSRIAVATSPSSGIDEAQNYFDSRRAEIAEKLNVLKSLNGNQISNETKERIKASLVNDASKVGNLRIRYVSHSISDPVFKAKLDKLVNDYQALLTGGRFSSQAFAYDLFQADTNHGLEYKHFDQTLTDIQFANRR